MAEMARPNWFASMRWLCLALVCLVWQAPAARAADPAVAFMEKVAKDLLSATRSKSPALISAVVHRYADTNYIGTYALGNYRTQLAAADRPGYLSGMVRFIGRYTAAEAPKFPVASYRITGSQRGSQGVMVDSVITLRDGSSYDVRWLLVPQGSTYRVRDAMVYGFWMTPMLRKLFENHIAEHGGHVRALVAVLSR